jgi:SMODS and SLOG-associating 2TM effector domain 3/SMODS and SLOG-associating 2TM effector domain 1
MTYPALFEAADEVAATSQRTFLRALRTELAALVAAALLGQLPARSLGGVGPVAALACFVVALVIRLSRIEDNTQRRWYDARAAAESVKSASWQFAVGGEAYRTDDPAAATRFQGDLHRYLNQLQHLDVPAGALSEAGVTHEMLALRRRPLAERAETYRRGRVDDQQDWYAANARRNRLRARRWWLATSGVEAGAIALGLTRVIVQFNVDWLGFAATVAAALAAWQQAKRYTELSESYAVTSHEVGLIRSSLDLRDPVDLRSPPNPVLSEHTWSQFVHDAEAAFSREHTLWLARRQGPVA